MDDHVKSIRRKLVEMHYQANTGHLGSSLSCVQMLANLYGEVIRPQDYFILSKGHAASALYATLHEFGHITDDQLETYFKPNTHLAIHPDSNWTKHILFSTGSLGHGLSLACGVAYAEKYLKETDAIAYVLLSDGEWDEGQTHEAFEFSRYYDLGSHCRFMMDYNGVQGFRTRQIPHLDNIGVPRTVIGKGISFLEGKLSSHYLPLTEAQYKQAMKELE